MVLREVHERGHERRFLARDLEHAARGGLPRRAQHHLRAAGRDQSKRPVALGVSLRFYNEFIGIPGFTVPQPRQYSNTEGIRTVSVG